MGILEPSFRYVPSSATDIRKTFARIRKQLKEEAEAKAKKNGKRKAQ